GFGGAQSRRKYQLDRLVIGQPIRLFLRDDAALDRLALDRLDVDAAAVVLERYHDEAIGVLGRELQAAYRWLARCDSLLGQLDTVIDGVADQVQQRIANLFDDRAIQLGVLALENEIDLLALLGSNVAHDARKAVEDALDRQHARLHHLLLQLVGDAADVQCGLLEVGQNVSVAELVDQPRAELIQARPIDDQLADQVEQRVEPRHVDADRGRAR